MATKKPSKLKSYRRRRVDLFNQKKWKELIRLLNEELEKFTLSENEKILVYLTMGHSYFMQYEFERGHEFYIKGINIIKYSDLSFIKVNVFEELMEFLINNNKIKIAKDLYLEVINLKLNKRDVETLKKFKI